MAAERAKRCRVCNCEVVTVSDVNLSRDVTCVVAFKSEVWADKAHTRKKLHTGIELTFAVCRNCFGPYLDSFLPKKEGGADG